jgi:hypothetical protein
MRATQVSNVVWHWTDFLSSVVTGDAALLPEDPSSSPIGLRRAALLGEPFYRRDSRGEGNRRRTSRGRL